MLELISLLALVALIAAHLSVRVTMHRGSIPKLPPSPIGS
jgi:hypothetical protein